MLQKITLLSGALVASSMAIHAQVTTSSIDGFVTTDGKEPTVGANVRLIHTPSGTEVSTFTNEKGFFYLEGLRTGGPYALIVENEGIAPYQIDNIFLVLGETFNQNINLADAKKVEELSEFVFVGTNDPIMNGNRTGASTNVNNKIINRMPTISRSLTDFTRLTPQANGNGFAGRDGRMNNLQIDGANFNNAFGLSSDPLPGGSNQPISLDAIEEISINIAPYDVRQTGFTGAGINAVTRSGTNEFEGSVYAFSKPNAFTGLDIREETLNPSARTNNAIYGARFGAPLIKNKLFFFGSFEYENSESAGNNWVANDGSATGSNVTRVLKSDLEAVSSFLKSKYGYDPGAYQAYANNYRSSNIKALARLDWNINNNHKMTVRFNMMNGSSLQGANASSGPNPRSSVARISSESMVFENGNYSFDNKVMSLTAELNSRFSEQISNQFLVTFSSINDVRGTTGNPFPFVDIWKDGKNYMSFGTELFSYDNEVINNNLTITNNVTYIKDRHTFTGGISFQSMAFGNSYKRMGTSYYRYNDLANFLAGGKPDVYGITYPYAGNDGYARVNFGLVGVYVQDKFNVNPWFSVTGGIRADVPLFLNSPLENPAISAIDLLDKNGNKANFTTGAWPKSTPLISPRVGFNWDVLKNKTLQLRGGTGIFTGNIPFVWFTNMPTNSGMLQNTFEPVPNSILDQITHLEKDPMYWVNNLDGAFPSQGGSSAPGSFSLIDNNFKMPQIWRSSLGLDYRVPSTPLTLTMDLLFSKDLVAVYQYNANRKAASAHLNFENDKRELWESANDAKYNPATGTIIPVLSNTNKGYSFAGTFGVTMREKNGMFGSIFYTYSNAKDVTGNPGSAANSAWSNNYSVNDPNELLLGFSQYAIPHRVVANFSYKIQNTTFSLFYNGSHQGRFAYTYSNDINRDGVSLDLLYIPSNINNMKFNDITKDGAVVFSADEQRRAFSNFINNNGLSEYAGKYVDRNSDLMPWLHRFDARFLQDILIKTKSKTHSIQLSLDVMNIGNLLSKNWGVLKQLNMGNDFAYGILKVDNIDANGVPTFQMNTTTIDGNTVLPETPFRDRFSASSTWGMQFGIRYNF